MDNGNFDNIGGTRISTNSASEQYTTSDTFSLKNNPADVVCAIVSLLVLIVGGLRFVSYDGADTSHFYWLILTFAGVTLGVTTVRLALQYLSEHRFLSYTAAVWVIDLTALIATGISWFTHSDPSQASLMVVGVVAVILLLWFLTALLYHSDIITPKRSEKRENTVVKYLTSQPLWLTLISVFLFVFLLRLIFDPKGVEEAFMSVYTILSTGVNMLGGWISSAANAILNILKDVKLLLIVFCAVIVYLCIRIARASSDAAHSLFKLCIVTVVCAVIFYLGISKDVREGLSAKGLSSLLPVYMIALLAMASGFCLLVFYITDSRAKNRQKWISPKNTLVQAVSQQGISAKNTVSNSLVSTAIIVITAIAGVVLAAMLWLFNVPDINSAFSDVIKVIASKHIYIFAGIVLLPLIIVNLLTTVTQWKNAENKKKASCGWLAFLTACEFYLVQAAVSGPKSLYLGPQNIWGMILSFAGFMVVVLVFDAIISLMLHMLTKTKFEFGSADMQTGETNPVTAVLSACANGIRRIFHAFLEFLLAVWTLLIEDEPVQKNSSDTSDSNMQNKNQSYGKGTKKQTNRYTFPDDNFDEKIFDDLIFDSNKEKSENNPQKAEQKTSNTVKEYSQTPADNGENAPNEADRDETWNRIFDEYEIEKAAQEMDNELGGTR